MIIQPGFHEDSDHPETWEKGVWLPSSNLPKWYSEWDLISVQQMIELIEATKGNHLKVEIYLTCKDTVKHNDEINKKNPPGSFDYVKDPDACAKMPRTPDIGLLFEGGRFGWSMEGANNNKPWFYGLGPGSNPEPWEIYMINLVEELQFAKPEQYQAIIQKFVDADK
jgi:hypothetical protein